MSLEKIKVPHSNVNDSVVRVLAWEISDQSEVSEGDHIVTVETSKAAEEIISPSSGFLRIIEAEGNDVAVGGVLGLISSSLDELPVTPDVDVETEINATKKARELAEKFNINLASVSTKGIIREQHVQALIDADVPAVEKDHPTFLAPVAQKIKLSKIQAATASAVIHSQRETATTFLLGEADVTSAEGVLQSILDEQDMLIGLTDLIAHLAARSLMSFPRLNATLSNDIVYEFSKINIGMAVEYENNLYLATINNANLLSLEDLATQRQELVMAIFRGEQDSSQVNGGTFAVTVLEQSAVTHQVPIIYPGHAGILGVGPIRDAVAIDANNDIVPTRTVGLTVSYDHRFINGGYAAKFLQQVVDGLSKFDGVS